MIGHHACVLVLYWAFVACTVLVVALAFREADPKFRRQWRAIAFVMWVLATVPFVGLLAFEREETGLESSLTCPLPNEDSTGAPSHWSWVPPGIVCEYPHGDEGPGYWRLPVVLALIGIPVALSRVNKRSRTPDPSRT